ncbi:uncharacterized protein PV09_04035 [Verruconis gallopava]|uniref:FYVE-type domain-containing protein n=1 Tax=Verruconis gallopava TaxID=253628 RepID=A0A0D2AD40_9PEZI|nr:uncharacterized protein PV09_04035 [Verruconis gallopava]KIW04853.1 hypothetical protein PV09_04035 [Verruconis gallopava]
MTTVFAQPPLAPLMPGPSAPTPIQHPISSQPYTSQAQFTPPSSSDTVSTVTSPVSPRASWNIPQHLQMHTRQIRQPKGPMYVPAVLRPTEKPVRSSPPKSRGMQYGSPESLDEFGVSERPSGVVPGMSRIVTEEWNEDVLGPVTGAPSRNHWKPDTASSCCDDSTCGREFTFFNRRHHCRRCGRIFCSEHSSHSVPLDHHARFHPEGQKGRACNSCWSDYRTWETARVSRSNSTNSRDGSLPGTPSIPLPGKRGFNDGVKAAASVAKSVPRDWNWSTF